MDEEAEDTLYRLDAEPGPLNWLLNDDDDDEGELSDDEVRELLELPVVSGLYWPMDSGLRLEYLLELAEGL